MTTYYHYMEIDEEELKQFRSEGTKQKNLKRLINRHMTIPRISIDMKKIGLR